jgi:hypothetical protein
MRLSPGLLVVASVLVAAAASAQPSPPPARLFGTDDDPRPGLRPVGPPVVANYEAGFFPRLGPRGLALSRFDELVFSCIGDDALTPVDVFAHDSAAGEELRRWLTHTGDVFLATRLSQWAQHRGAEAALESEPVRPDRRMLEARYRLSKVGQAIRRQGLQDIGQGPPVAVFGAVAYAPLAPWVVLDDAATGPSLQRFEILAEESLA